MLDYSTVLYLARSFRIYTQVLGQKNRLSMDFITEGEKSQESDQNYSREENYFCDLRRFISALK